MPPFIKKCALAPARILYARALIGIGARRWTLNASMIEWRENCALSFMQPDRASWNPIESEFEAATDRAK
ncbi:MAG TPA: hypothetical protein DDY14_05710 [Chromatiaceae bacterium]|jgi:hypothetical protein|nr:MAG: hypothetical protein N838_22985 [Thiohalocapsa sp. PB-PSB1]HBG94814.1 hypothetical protein [Chromatiaceae bacterium]HCS88919.1 hypothetical protein [Chromatiaceae bacterium]